MTADMFIARAVVTRCASIAFAIGGVLALVHWTHRIQTSAIYGDDFAQDYLLARAVLDGTNPYAVRAPDLAIRYLPDAELRVIPYVIPHPPALAFLTLPMALLSYQCARAAWLAFEVAAVIITSLLIFSGERTRYLSSALIAAGALMVWPPIAIDLYYGQWSIAVTVLLIGCWLSYRCGRVRLAGGLLGGAIAVKLFPGALLVYFAVKRSWTVVAWAAGTAVVLTLLPALLVGPSIIMRYIASGVTVPAVWLSNGANYSVIGAVARVLGQSGPDDIPSLFGAPALVAPAIAVVAGVLIAIASRVIRRVDEDHGFAAALCLLALLTPLVWQHYLSFLTWPLVVVFYDLKTMGSHRWRARALFLAWVFVTVPQALITWVATALSSSWSPAGAILLLVLPAGPGLLLLLALRGTAGAYKNGIRLAPDGAGRG